MQSIAEKPEQIINNTNYDTIINNINKINIVDSKYNVSILNKMKTYFTDSNKQLFLFNFYTYINYDQYKDFVIDGDKFWQLLDFKTKGDFKRSLINKCIENEDYIIQKIDKNKKEDIEFGGAGLNKETILLTVYGFKKFCMSIQTKKAKEIHEYYLKLEEIINEVISEEAKDLKLLLLQKDQKIAQLETDKQTIITDAELGLIKAVQNMTVLYIGLVEDSLLKFGISKCLDDRILKSHKNNFNKFELLYVFPTDNYIKLEALIKYTAKNDSTSPLYKRHISKFIKGLNQTELLQIDSEILTIKNIEDIVIGLRVACDKKYADILRAENQKMKSVLYDLGLLDFVIGKSSNHSLSSKSVSNEIRKIITNGYMKNYLKNNTIETETETEIEIEIEEDEDEEVEEEEVKVKKVDKEEEEVREIKVKNIEEPPDGYGYCCRHCKDFVKLELIGINPLTTRPYSACISCRKHDSDTKFKSSEEERKLKKIEEDKYNEELEIYCEKLLNNSSNLTCSNCKTSKSPVDFGIDKKRKEIYRMCTVCRDNMAINKKEQPIIEGSKTFCGTCRLYFPEEYNETARRNYKTCKPCREHDKIVSSRKFDVPLTEDGLVICKFCKSGFEKELTAKKDGYFRTCKKCRPVPKNKPYDQKRYELNQNSILMSKVEYYNENKEEIRNKQKEYYDANREKILLQKRNKS